MSKSIKFRSYELLQVTSKEIHGVDSYRSLDGTHYVAKEGSEWHATLTVSEEHGLKFEARDSSALRALRIVEDTCKLMYDELVKFYGDQG